MLKLAHPLLTNLELEKLRRVSNRDLLATTFPHCSGPATAKPDSSAHSTNSARELRWP